MKKILPLLLLSTVAFHASAREAFHDVDHALQQAGREHAPVLVDFHAVWCYSCYYMATHVLNGPQWEAIEKRIVVADVDTDSPDGARWMKQLNVKALPSYVVLNADGSELGRILAEQPREKFYPQLERILGGGDSLAALQAKVKQGSTAAVADVLAGYHARDQMQEATDWFAGLPQATRDAAAKDAHVTLWQNRIQLEKAAKAKDAQTCSAAAQRALAGDVGCDRYYVLETLLDCSEKIPAAQRKTLLAAQRPALDELVAKQVFIDTPTCADQRTAVMVSADLDAAIGDKAAESAVLEHAIERVQRQLGSDLAKDRNLADNLRVYLTRAKRDGDLDALMPKLMAAYPDDYVYAHRFGRSLLEHGKAAEALPYLEQAAEKSFGVNRLAVATTRVKALLVLNRRGDAEKVVAEALEQNGPWFPEQAEKLKASLKS